MPTGRSAEPARLPTAPPGTVRWPGTLRRRYVTTFVLLVSLPLLAYGLISASLAYRQQRDALAALQRAQADAAGVRILELVNEVELQLAWLSALPWVPGTAPQRRLEALRALKLTPAITDLVLVDGHGLERVAESRLELSRIESLADRSASPAVAGALARGRYHGDVYFRKGSEPYMTVAVAGPDQAGVAIAEVSLKYIWDVVSRIRIGSDGIVYVVDPAGRLIAHPDINLVLRNTDLSDSLRALEQAAGGEGGHRVLELQGTRGVPALASSILLAPLGWRVVVEQSQQEADAPLWVSVRSALWVAAASLALALAAALVSAWRLVRPLRQLTAGAERLGAGELGHRIELRSADELEQLGARFNAMAAELQASHAGLEQQVQQRTRELSEANRAKSRLLAAASHDLRQPLHALNLMVAQLHIEPDPAQRERLGLRVEQAIGSINALFDGLLDVSKLDAGVIRPEPATFAIQPLLDRMDVAHSASARAKGLELRIRACGTWVHTDALLLERIVGNLVANAVRYTRSGAILLACRQTSAGLRIGVWDTGIGIAPDKLDRIFDEFYRVTPAMDGPGEGLGLGLSIVARLAELLGHRVAVRSTPGRGSCFSITVPTAAPAVAVQTPVSLPGLDALAGRRVVVVDNNDQVLASTVELLRGWGCRVQPCSDMPGPAAGLDQEAELLLVDMHLDHGNDGLSVIARLRGELGREVPALIMTGDVALATRERITGAGVPMLEKPIAALKLRSALTRLLQRS